MPTLNWMGKEKVVNHHRDVPFRVLERIPEKGVLDSRGSDCGNMIIHGDNLEALKALMPEYEGKVDCIYIDPPYNTGNEGWVYNDNVNDPRIKKWLGQVVGKEGEDFSRHDKWLCMMYPRLQLLRKLLAPTGAIFISIDDNEQANLKLMCEEIFGTSCFVADISWQRTLTKRNDSKGIPSETEHVLIYSKMPNWTPRKLPRTESMNSGYSSPDGDPQLWTSVTCSAPGAATHQGMVYGIQHPITGAVMYPPNGRHWSLGQDRMIAEMGKWAEYELRNLDDACIRQEICAGSDVDEKLCGIMLVNCSEEALGKSKERYDRGAKGIEPWPTFFFTSKGKGGMRAKKYLQENAGRVATNHWPADEVGTTDGAKRLIAKVFEGSTPFDTPKPPELIERCIALSCGDDALILDSFAGSGTTAHAAMRLNQEDGGNRRYILVEMMDYADTVTAERVRRVISGYGEGKNAVAGIDSGFSYYELGPALLHVEEPPIASGSASPMISLNADAPADAVRRYVWHTETRAEYVDRTGECPWLLGEHAQAAYYLVYVPGEETVLDYDLLGEFPVKGSPTVVYANRCALSPDQLEAAGVAFKQIPSQIARM